LTGNSSHKANVVAGEKIVFQKRAYKEERMVFSGKMETSPLINSDRGMGRGGRHGKAPSTSTKNSVPRRKKMLDEAGLKMARVYLHFSERKGSTTRSNFQLLKRDLVDQENAF